MNGNSLVLDTNIVLYLLAGDSTISEFLEGKQGYVSVITELELIGYPDIEDTERIQIREFLATCSIVDINDAMRTIYSSLRKRYRLKLGDAAAAATAIQLGIPFMSADRGFNKVEELQFMLYNP